VETFFVESTPANVPVLIVASNGNDSINVGNSTTTLDGILGALTGDGQASFDTLNVNDTQSASSGPTVQDNPTART
jgi:hypothetical protein